jgi:hypothetical protein
VDYTPIVRAIKATNADIVFVASYPPDSVGMLRAALEVGLQPKIFGGGMVGLQFTSVMQSMGPSLNGIVNYDFWAPEPPMLAMTVVNCRPTIPPPSILGCSETSCEARSMPTESGG